MRRAKILGLALGIICVSSGCLAQYRPYNSCDQYNDRVTVRACRAMMAAAARNSANAAQQPPPSIQSTLSGWEQPKGISTQSEAAKKLAEELERSKRLEEARRIEASPTVHAQRIRELKYELAAYQRQLDTEREIGRESGYVNKVTMYRGGEMIVYIKKQIASEYQQYLASGGKKSISAL